MTQKLSAWAITLAILTSGCSKEQSVGSGVYRGEDLKFVSTSYGQLSELLQGRTRDLDYLSIDIVTMQPGLGIGEGLMEDRNERLIIVKEGVLNIQIGDLTQAIGPRSVAIILPGDPYLLGNRSSNVVTYYDFSFESVNKPDPQRGTNGGGSIMIDWKDLEFHPHDRGGVRNYYDRETTMCRDFEMHVTTLNGGIKSHEPHTHRAGEFLLMIQGNTEMEIGDAVFQATGGDLYFMESEISHGIRNLGSEPCMYFAFQFE